MVHFRVFVFFGKWGTLPFRLFFLASASRNCPSTYCIVFLRFFHVVKWNTQRITLNHEMETEHSDVTRLTSHRELSCDHVSPNSIHVQHSLAVWRGTYDILALTRR